MNRRDCDSEPSTSASLLQCACRGDVDGWRRLAHLYGPIVYAWARRSGFQEADAADVMQDTFAAVAKALPTFDDERQDATFRGWLWTITRNKLRDHARAAEAQAVGGTEAMIRMQQIPEESLAKIQSDDPPSEPLSDAASVRRQAIALLRESVDPRSWRMFWETTIETRDPADVAEEMGVSRWAVYKSRARVLHRLQLEMKGLE